MSASKKKDLRRQNRESGMSRREEQLAKQQQEREKLRRNTTIVVTAFLVFALVVVLLSTPVLYGLTAITSGNYTFTTADFNYHYSNTYSNYYQTYTSYYGESAQYFMPGRETMNEYAMESLHEVAVLATAAAEAGFTLSEEGEKTVENARQGVEMISDLQNVSRGKYLRTSYGAGVNMKTFLRNVELSTIAMEYEAFMRESFQYDEDVLQAHYEENRNDYDYVTYNSYYFAGKAVEDDPETDEDETVDAQTALAEAEAQAEEFLRRLRAGETFASLTYEFSGENEAYAGEEAGKTSIVGKNLSSIYKDWLLDDTRKAGDAYIASADNGCYVLEFLERDDNDYASVNVRHILIAPAEVAQDAEDYEAAVAAALEEAKTEAENILATWKEGDADEASFAELADANSDDNSAVGGLYERIGRHKMVGPFEEWIFDSGRKAGDVDIVETEYGYHVIYFVGTDADYCDVVAEENMRAADYEAWITGQRDACPVETNLFYKLFCK